MAQEWCACADIDHLDVYHRLLVNVTEVKKHWCMSKHQVEYYCVPMTCLYLCIHLLIKKEVRDIWYLASYASVGPLIEALFVSHYFWILGGLTLQCGGF